MAISFNSGFMAAMGGQSSWFYFETLIATCLLLGLVMFAIYKKS